ncbi:S41 family peptidase [Candidatus Parcubacteria bacterium]|nr:MAG: S41 family peptidase [Candidatus Parcubacteria bacterium]
MSLINNKNSSYLNGIRTLTRRLIGVVLLLIVMVASFAGGVYFAGLNYSSTGQELGQASSSEDALWSGKVKNTYSPPPDGKLSQDVDFNLFWQVWDTLKEKYVDSAQVTDKKMFYGALKGMAAALGDPYTVFMDPKAAHDFEEDLAGTFEGIGAEIGIKNDTLTIIAPLPDMPAEKAGLKAGDQVYAIDGESTLGITIDEAVRKIRGPKGTQVTLTIWRKGFDNTKDITITRGTIVVKSVRTNLREDNIFVIKIISFNNDTEDLFNKAVREAINKSPRGIILDLRNNPGGFLDTAIEMASEWIEDGTVVIEKFNEERQNEYLARGRARLKGFPTVVLVNRGSASASEIVAGALQDYGLAVVVGEKTFGKGSVQTLEKFSDGSSVKVTIAKWLTPKGRSINDEGIEPDIKVKLTLDDYNHDRDPQVEAAIKVLTEGIEEAQKFAESLTASSTASSTPTK